MCVILSFLDDVGTSGESSAEFLTLYKKLFAKDHWKYYLAVKGVPVKLSGLITKVRRKLLICLQHDGGRPLFSISDLIKLELLLILQKKCVDFEEIRIHSPSFDGHELMCHYSA